MFRADFPKLSNFIGSWFPDSDFEDVSDFDLVRAAVSRTSVEALESVKQELRLVLVLQPIPYDEIGQEANLHFNSEKECAEWLTQLQKWLDQEVNGESAGSDLES